MAKYVAALASDISPGSRKLVSVGGRAVLILNIAGEYFALHNRCPHQGASLCHGQLTGLVTSSGAGEYSYTRSGEILRCPWHGWEYDVRTGESWFDPQHTKVRHYHTELVRGDEVVKGPYKLDLIPVVLEDEYLTVTL